MSAAPESPSGELASRAARGTVISLAGQVATHGLRLVSNLLLARLLAPDAFGLMLVVNAVTSGLQMISEVGIWQAVVQSKRVDRAFLDTAWTLAVLRGLGLFAAGCAAAAPAVWIYRRNELLWLLPLCALQAVLLGLESTKSAQLNRRIAVGRLVAVEVGSQVLALAVSLPIAYATRSPGALAAAALVAIAARTVGSHVLLPGPANRFRLEREAARALFSFGAWVFVSTTLLFVGARWDVFVLGKLEGMELVGVYGMAQMILSVPAQMIERAMSLVLLPVFAERFRDQPASFGSDVPRARAVVVPAAAALFLGAAVTAPAFFEWLYRDAYHDAGWLTQLAVGAAWFLMLQDLSVRAIVATGATRLLAVANGARLVATVAATTVGFLHWGVVGFIVGNAIGAAAGAAAAALVLGRLGARVLGGDLAMSCGFLALLAVACGGPRLWAVHQGGDVALLTLVVGVVLTAPLAIVAVRRARSMLTVAQSGAATPA